MVNGFLHRFRKWDLQMGSMGSERTRIGDRNSGVREMPGLKGMDNYIVSLKKNSLQLYIFCRDLFRFCIIPVNLYS
jgi:hypothetical protein